MLKIWIIKGDFLTLFHIILKGIGLFGFMEEKKHIKTYSQTTCNLDHPTQVGFRHKFASCQ